MTKTAPIQLDFNYRGIGLDIRYARIPIVEHQKIYDEFYSPIYGISQSAQRVAERGGFGVCEALRLGYDNPLVIWVSGGKYPDRDSEWIKIALKFNEDKSYRFVVLSEEDYKSTDLFDKIKHDYDI